MACNNGLTAVKPIKVFSDCFFFFALQSLGKRAKLIAEMEMVQRYSEISLNYVIPFSTGLNYIPFHKLI